MLQDFGEGAFGAEDVLGPAREQTRVVGGDELWLMLALFWPDMVLSLTCLDIMRLCVEQRMNWDAVKMFNGIESIIEVK